MSASMRCRFHTLLSKVKLYDKIIYFSNNEVVSSCRFISGSTTNKSSPDIERIFIQPKVQKILKAVTGLNQEKIFSTHFTDLKTPRYKLLTDVELKESEDWALRKAFRKLWMPPVMNARTSQDVVLAEDSAITGHDESSYMFTDITYGIPDEDRIMVVRETCGQLRCATGDERDRLLNIYFPRKGRMYNMPKMFEEKQMELLLQMEKHLYILDRACIQFEPDDINFIRVTRRIYEHLSEHNMFHLLHSTRHFGPMSLYLTFYNRCENLLVYMIQNNKMKDAYKIVQLHNIIYPDTQSAKLSSDQSIQDVIQVFAEHDTKHGEMVILALQATMDAEMVETG